MEPNPIDAPKTLAIADITAVLDQFLSGQLTESQLVDWAIRLECQEDVEYVATSEGSIAKALFELATPEINGSLTMKRITEIRSELVSHHTVSRDEN